MSIKEKINKGLQHEKNQTFYHTGPHHDDIMLGMMPHVMHLMREKSNTHHFINMTSGFTSVTNGYLIEVLESTLALLNQNKIQMIEFANFFDEGFNLKCDKDVYHYLDALAQNNIEEQKRALAHRMVRSFIKIFNVEIDNIISISNKLLLQGLLEKSDTHFKLSPKGYDIMNSILVQILDSLDNIEVNNVNWYY